MRRNRWVSIVLVVLATACGPDDTEEGGGQPTATTAPDTTGTTAPATDPSGSTSGPNLWFDGIWPDSRAALDVAKVALDQGHQPWWADPVATARAYLIDHAVEEPVMGDFIAGGGGVGRVAFESGAVSGTVTLRQTEPDLLPYVVRIDSRKAIVVATEHEGDTLRVEVASLAAGTLVARAGSFGSEWQDEQRAPAEEAAPPVHFILAVDGSRFPLMLEVRHEGADGAIGLTRVRVQPSVPSMASTTPAGQRLSTTSELRPDGLGPIAIGMTQDQALAAAGVPMVVIGREHCEMLRGSGGPDFVHFVATAGFEGRISAITVFGDTVSTVEGIHHGSTEAEVTAAYPGIERRGDGDAHRLVHRLPGSRNAGDPVLVFVVVNSTVVGMQAGIGAVVESEEYCS